MTQRTPGLDGVTEQTRAAAFRLLLETGRAVAPEQIAADLSAAPPAVAAELRRLDAVGRASRSKLVPAAEALADQNSCPLQKLL